MVRINLLPIKAAQRQLSARNEMFGAGLLVAATIAGLFFWYGSVSSSITDMERKIQTLDADIARLTEEATKVEVLQGKEKKVQDKLKIINELVDNRTGPARMLDAIASIMTNEAKRVWLTKLTQKKKGKLVLTGGAMDHEDISEFQMALERRDMFSKVRLMGVKTGSAKSGQTQISHLTWELSCVAKYNSG